LSPECVGINARLDRMSREMGEVSSAVKSGDRARAGQTIGIQKRIIAKRKSGRNDLGGIEGTTVGRRRNEVEEEQPRRPVKRRRTLPIVSRTHTDEDGVSRLPTCCSFVGTNSVFVKHRLSTLAQPLRRYLLGSSKSCVALLLKTRSLR